MKEGDKSRPDLSCRHTLTRYVAFFLGTFLGNMGSTFFHDCKSFYKVMLEKGFMYWLILKQTFFLSTYFLQYYTFCVTHLFSAKENNLLYFDLQQGLVSLEI